MTPPQSNAKQDTSQAVVIERLNQISTQLLEASANWRCTDQRIAALDLKYTENHIPLVERVKTHDREIEELKAADKDNQTALEDEKKRTTEEFEKLNRSIVALTNKIQPLLTSNKIVTWVAILIGSALFALLWGIITHSITLSFP